MLVQVLDRLVILAFLYFLYMLLFYLPPHHCPPPTPSSPSPPPDTLPTYPPPNFENTILCPRDEEADKIMKAFLEVQYKSLDGIKQDGKFVVYSATDSAGFGNRIPALVSSFILALILERGFLVHWPEVSQKNLTDEFDENSIVMPVFSDLFIPPVPIDMLAIPSYYSFLDDKTAVPIKLDDAANTLLCDDLSHANLSRQFIVIRGYRPFFDLLFHNSHLATRVREKGLASGRTVHALASCLLRPVPQVLDMVRQFKEENKITNNQKLVGVHIRKQSQHGLTDKEQEGLWSCVRKKYPSPDFWRYDEWGELKEEVKTTGDQVNEEETYKGVISDGEERRNRSVVGSKVQNATHIYFLASDSESTIDVVPPDFLPLGGGIARSTSFGIIRALADIWILGHSVELFGAQGTTFLSAVRTLFPSESNLAVVGGKKVDKYCRAVGELPCYKWWDIFQSRDVPEFKLSCFSANATAKQIVVC